MGVHVFQGTITVNDSENHFNACVLTLHYLLSPLICSNLHPLPRMPFPSPFSCCFPLPRAGIRQPGLARALLKVARARPPNVVVCSQMLATLHLLTLYASEQMQPQLLSFILAGVLSKPPSQLAFFLLFVLG
jgi:hypothetical protein